MTIACNSSDTTVTDNTYFDLKSYFKEEIKRKAGISLQKTVKINEKSETKTIDTPNLEEELSIFLNSDINKPAWLDKYTTDSTHTNGKLSKITYTTTAPKLKTKELRIELQDGNVQAIAIQNHTKNTVYTTIQSLNYLPGTGYTIKTEQNIELSEPQIFHIQAEWLTK